MSRSLPAAGLAAELGAEIPVIAAPMAGGPSTPELVLAAASAGGIGFLAGGYKTAEQLAEEIAQVRSETSRFGVNLFVPNPVPVDPDEYRTYRNALQPWAEKYRVELPEDPKEDDDAWQDKLHLLRNSPVPVVSFTFGLPDQVTIATLQRAGSEVLQTVTNAAEARQAEDAAVDGLIVQSSQAGGHSGTWTPHQPLPDTETLTLVQQIRAVSTLPVWAAGGISTPAAVQELLSAGAEAAIVGTVLLRTPESGAHAAHKQALADPAHPDPLLTRAFSGRPARALRNAFAEEFTASAPLGFPALHYLTSPLRRAAAAEGDPTALNLWAGTGYAAAAAEPAADLLRRLAGE